jgi:hypothetical protein
MWRRSGGAAAAEQEFQQMSGSVGDMGSRLSAAPSAAAASGRLNKSPRDCGTGVERTRTICVPKNNAEISKTLHAQENK